MTGHDRQRKGTDREVKKDILLSIMNEINSTDIVAEYMILLQIANRFNRNQITHIDKVLLHRKKPLEYSEEMLSQANKIFKDGKLEVKEN